MNFYVVHDEQVDAVLCWLADYRMMGGISIDGLLEGLILGCALATRHPEWLQAFARAACAAEDVDLEELPDGHSWLEHIDVVDLLVDECPWETPR